MKPSDFIENGDEPLDCVLPLEDEVKELIQKLVITSDEQHGELVDKVWELFDAVEGTEDAEVLHSLVDAIVTYEEKRWPI